MPVVARRVLFVVPEEPDGPHHGSFDLDRDAPRLNLNYMQDVQEGTGKIQEDLAKPLGEEKERSTAGAIALRIHRTVNPHLQPQRTNDLLSALHFRRPIIARLVALDLLLFQPDPLGEPLPAQAAGDAGEGPHSPRREAVASLNYIPTRGRFMNCTTAPYHDPTRPSSSCSMSSSSPNLLVQRPLANCRAACLGAPARA